MEKYILALDQGTTSSRAMLINKMGRIVSVTQKELLQYFPAPGWVEHDPVEIWSSLAGIAAESTVKWGIDGSSISAIGITNQRETVVVWNKKTGKPVYNAIVWQDKRTANYCDTLKAQGKSNLVKEKTGLVIDAYFSATKVKWILDHVEGARALAEAGELALGTVDSWIVWNFTKGELHITDVTNASRTLLFNINTMQWDDELLALFDVPKSMLPEVKQSSEIYGYTKSTIFASKIPIAGIAGDQQAALFGQMCTKAGMVKNTYGTGCFMLMNIGCKPILSQHQLLTTVAWKISGETQYAFEGSVFIGGAVVQWLRDGLKIINQSSDVEQLASSVDSSGGVYFVPAFVGLGAPYWNQHAQGVIFGLSRGTTNAHIARAAIEAIAYQTMDILKLMEADSGIKIEELRVDGGATVNNLLMQFQADVLNTITIRPKVIETTVMGAAFLAGLAVGFWENLEEIEKIWSADVHFKPNNNRSKFEKGIQGWKQAMDACQYFANQNSVSSDKANT